MTDGDPKDTPPKSRGEQLAERLAGSNPVEPKPVVGEETPNVQPKPHDGGRMDPPSPNEPIPPAVPPTMAPVESGAADAMNVKPAEAKAHAGGAADAPTNVPAKAGAANAPPKSDAKAAANAKPAAKTDAKPAAKAEAKPAAKADKPKVDADKIPEAPPWYKTLRADPPFYVRFALGAALVALVLGLWWFLTRGSATEAIISPVKLPSPGSTFGASDKLLERDLVDSIIDSLQRVGLGVGLAALVGVGLGVISGAHRGVSATLAPLVIFLRSVPMGALLPLTLMMFSDGEKQKYMFIFLAVVPFVFSDTMKAVSSVPDRYVETAQTLGASKLQIIMKVLVPLSLPDILTSLRFQIGLALGYIMLAEAGSTFVEHGLGKMIVLSEKRGWTEQVFLLLFIIALLAFVLDLLLRTLQRGIFPWRKDL